MVDALEFKSRAKKFYFFTRNELRDILISVIVVSFIWAFGYGSEDTTAAGWIGHFIGVIIMVAIVFLVNISAYKLMAIFHGFMAEYSVWMMGLILGIIVTLITKGIFPLILPGGIALVHLSRLRIGYFRYGLNVWQSSQVAMAGPFANVLLVMFTKTMQWILNIESAWLDDFFVFSLVFAVYMMLPIPPLPGVIAFFGSKLAYVFMFSLLLMYVLLIVIFGYYSLIAGIILGVIVYIIFYRSVELK